MSESSINKEEIVVPAINAAAARKLVDKSHSISRDHSGQFQELREDLATRQLSRILLEIEAAANSGKTQMECVVRDRWIPSEHREEALQILKSYLDHRGFNVLSYWQQSIWGGQTVIQIEW